MSEEKTFTQEQVDNIIKDRLAKEKAKYDAALVEKEKEFNHRELLLEARESLTKKGLPIDLLDALNTSSREAFDKSLSIIEERIKSSPAESRTSPTATPAKVSTGGAHNENGGIGDDVRAAMGLK